MNLSREAGRAPAREPRPHVAPEWMGKLKHTLQHTALLALLLAVVWISPACKHRKVAERQTVEESGPPTLSSTVHMGDPRAATQLVAGFHDIEAHAWRWSMRQFSVYLRPPLGSRTKGAVLVLSFTVPPVVIETEKSISLSASVNGNKLPPETWSKPGNYVYQRDLPPELMTGDGVRVDFELDKAMPPNEKDGRELGVVVSKVGLELK